MAMFGTEAFCEMMFGKAKFGKEEFLTAEIAKNSVARSSALPHKPSSARLPISPEDETLKVITILISDLHIRKRTMVTTLLAYIEKPV
jgi:hypothetical protein